MDVSISNYIMNSSLFSLDLAILYMGEGTVADKIERIREIYSKTNEGSIPSKEDEWETLSSKRLALFYQVLYLTKINQYQDEFTVELTKVYSEDMNSQNAELLKYFYIVELWKLMGKESYPDKSLKTIEGLEQKYRFFKEFNEVVDDHPQFKNTQLHAFMSGIKVFTSILLNQLDKISETTFKAINLHPTEVYHTMRQSENTNVLNKSLFEMH